MLSAEAKTLAIVAGVGAIALYFLVQGGARNISRGVATLPGEIIGGAIEGVGSSFGIPVTDEERCNADLAAGRLWDASFSCPAGRFIREGVF